MSNRGSQAVCSSRTCDSPVAGVGSFSGLAFCAEHLRSDAERVRGRQAQLLGRLRVVGEPADSRALMMADLQTLAVEVQQVREAFDAVHDRLQQWKGKVMSRVQAAHDAVARRLRDAAEAEQCEKDVTIAADAGDMRKVMELTASMESWLDEACERSTEFERARSLGGVAAGVQQLQLMIDRHMADVMQQCSRLEHSEHSEHSEEKATAPPLCRPVATIGCLRSGPYHLASCTNTAGFVGDPSGCVARAEPAAAERRAQLPQPCVFVSFEPECADHLLVTSLDGATKLRFNCHNLDWSKWINGLHCDSRRQLLFVAQTDAVTMTDLSGRVARVTNAGSLGQPIGWIGGIAGSSDQVFVLDTEKQVVLSISKDSGQLESFINVGAFNGGGLHELGVHGSQILLVDFKSGQVLRTSCGSGDRLVTSYPTERSSLGSFAHPWKVTIDSSGLMFVTEYAGHTVRVLSSDGEILQTLGTEGLSGSDETCFAHPIGVTVAEVAADGLKRLVVADSENFRLRVYDVL